MKSAADEPSTWDSFWNERWRKGQTGWDVGHASPSITAYMSQYANKHAAILIPGCGNAYEAAWFVDHGFTNITLLDIAPYAVEQIKKKFAGNKQVEVICGDFFEHDGQYDLMIEQTFFCAIPPERRRDYVAKAASLLRSDGRIIGVLFDRSFEMGPPFGGSVSEYKSLFSPSFFIKKMEACYNSILPRSGSELFINLVRKDIAF